MKASIAVTIGNIDPKTTASETNPLVVATPSSKFPKKSAAPIIIKIGRSFLLKPPNVLNLASRSNATIKVVQRIVVIVIIALVWDPFAIKVIAPPNPKAAMVANISGFAETPPRISGPLAQNPPSNATHIPII